MSALPERFPRGSAPLKRIAALLRQKEMWETSDLIAAVSPEGITAKQVYNHLKYLQRKGTVHHLGYGAYAALPPSPDSGVREKLLEIILWRVPKNLIANEIADALLSDPVIGPRLRGEG